MKNVKLLPNYTQVCVWPGTIVEPEEIEEFQQFLKQNMDVDVQYLETIVTFPNKDENGNDISGTGGRHDVFFAIADKDIGKFAIPRLSLGIRWIEDVLSSYNYSSPIYPERVFEYKS